MPSIRAALAGNPNAGKSTIFNALTGGNQHVGNWPGKTVERAVGQFSYRGVTVEVVDLPGAYSLTAYSPEEEITRNYLLHDQPDVVINVVDAANLERNLYLTLQLLEMGIPLIIVANMADVAEQRGLQINYEVLANELHQTPVIPTVGRNGAGIEALRQAILNACRAAKS